MSINNRYEPSHPVGQTLIYGLDFSAILPPGVTILGPGSGVTAEYNTVPPTPTLDLTVVPLAPPVGGRRIYATVSGGLAGKDYRLNYLAVDSLGNVILRTVLLLCAGTS